MNQGPGTNPEMLPRALLLHAEGSAAGLKPPGGAGPGDAALVRPARPGRQGQLPRGDGVPGQGTWRLGQKEQARAILDRLRATMKGVAAGAVEARAFLREAEGLLEGQAEKPKR